MAIKAGVEAQITISKDGSDSQSVIYTGHVFRWVKRGKRSPAVDVTPLNSRAMKFRPGQEVHMVELSAWIDQDDDPGEFNDPQYAVTVTVRTDSDDANKLESFAGHVIDITWTTGVDEPNRLDAVILGTGSLTHTWTS